MPIITKTILAISLAAVFVVSMIMTPAEAANPMHVKDFAYDSGDLVLTTQNNHAGSMIPDETNTIFAYVAFTSDGIFAATSHFGTDNDPVNSPPLEWHTHKVTLDSNNCVTALETVGTVSFNGNTVTISGTGASDILGATGAMLKISDAGVCVKKSL